MSKKIWRVMAAVFAVMVLTLSACDEIAVPGMEGNWVMTSFSGDVPASAPNLIVFTGSGNAGTGHFEDRFWGTTVNFSWSLIDNQFDMTRFPGADGIIGAHSWRLQLDVGVGQLTINYNNGSSATWTLQ